MNDDNRPEDFNNAKEEPAEDWTKPNPGEKITRPFLLRTAAIGLLAVALLLSLYVYVAARQQLGRDFRWVSAGFALAPDDSASIASGMHVAATRGCQDCHGSDYSGKVLQDDWRGRFVAPNLTSGKGSVTNGYFDDDWIKAIKHGIGPDNRALLLMPSTDYNNLSDSDLLQLIAFLKQLPPKDHALPKKRLTFGTDWAIALGRFPPIAANNIDHGSISVGAVRPDTTIAYGQYISSPCSGCHGAGLRGAAGPNLTSSGDLGKWSFDDFSRTITHGTLPNGQSLKPQMPWKSFSSFNETELRALFKYLKSLQ